MMQRDELRDLYFRIRRFTEVLCEPLETEDYVVQSMPDVSPTKWHLAHTSWFFETFILRTAVNGYSIHNGMFQHLFNSYYKTVGDPFPRLQRGFLSRPTVAEVYAFREHVDRAMERFFADASGSVYHKYEFIAEVGLNHEEQHQELILTDIKHVLASNPLQPAYRKDLSAAPGEDARLGWTPFAGGMVEVGYRGESFSFDNERPRHCVYLRPFEIANRLVTAREYVEFMDDGGYHRPDLWLSDGWDARMRLDWFAPLYWQKIEGEWQVGTLSGSRAVDPNEPVCHISYYEADAYARWAGARLPREEEWETAAADETPDGNFVERGHYHPVSLATRSTAEERPAQLFGDTWEWTASPYTAYPGYVPYEGSLGEYNGKFMCNQMVLRGGSCATSRRHIRSTYRNFFPPEARWQFSGIRLARP